MNCYSLLYSLLYIEYKVQRGELGLPLLKKRAWTCTECGREASGEGGSPLKPGVAQQEGGAPLKTYHQDSPLLALVPEARCPATTTATPPRRKHVVVFFFKESY